MEFINLSEKPLKLAGKKEGLLKLVVLPDYCPGRGLLPTGIVAVYDRETHEISEEYLGQDAGCGMTLARFETPLRTDLEQIAYNTSCQLFWQGSRKRGIGGGNHFISFYDVTSTDGHPLGLKQKDSVVLIHTGSRLIKREKKLDSKDNKHEIEEYEKIRDNAELNRRYILELVKKSSPNRLKVLLDRAHNTMELTPNKIIYRKGAIKLLPGEIGIIPSTIGGDAVLVRGRNNIYETENSMCHGVGRRVSRSEAKTLFPDFDELRKRVYIPNQIEDRQIWTEHPDFYQNLEEVLIKAKDYIDVIGRLRQRATIMQ